MGFMYIKFSISTKKSTLSLRTIQKVTFYVWKSGESSFNPKIYNKKNPTANGELENA